MEILVEMVDVFKALALPCAFPDSLVDKLYLFLCRPRPHVAGMLFPVGVIDGHFQIVIDFPKLAGRMLRALVADIVLLRQKAALPFSVLQLLLKVTVDFPVDRGWCPAHLIRNLRNGVAEKKVGENVGSVVMVQSFSLSGRHDVPSFPSLPVMKI